MLTSHQPPLISNGGTIEQTPPGASSDEMNLRERMEEHATHQQPFIIEMEVGGGRTLKINLLTTSVFTR